MFIICSQNKPPLANALRIVSVPFVARRRENSSFQHKHNHSRIFLSIFFRKVEAHLLPGISEVAYVKYSLVRLSRFFFWFSPYTNVTKLTSYPLSSLLHFISLLTVETIFLWCSVLQKWFSWFSFSASC